MEGVQSYLSSEPIASGPILEECCTMLQVWVKIRICVLKLDGPEIAVDHPLRKPNNAELRVSWESSAMCNSEENVIFKAACLLKTLGNTKVFL